jgi:NADPH:quinone reductase-like Zn-dependent oxidoreductase
MALENLQLRSLIKKSGELELSLVKLPVADPAPDEIVVRIEGTPINPSDLGLLVGRRRGSDGRCARDGNARDGRPRWRSDARRQ